MKQSARGVVAVAMTALVSFTVAVPAQGDGHDQVVVEGVCSGRSDWKLKASEEDGRIEIEGEVDSNRVGQRWKWRLWHNGSLSSKGRRTTQWPSGSFEVRRLVVDLAGVDRCTFVARNLRSGELCRGFVTY